MARIVISGYYGYDNLGDEAILAAMLKNLREKIPGGDLLVLSAQPEKTSRIYGVEAINRFDFLSIWRELRKADLLLSGGGSLLQDVTSKRSIPYYLSLVFLAHLLGKKTVFYAQGIGPVQGGWGKFLLRHIAPMVDLITVRDEDSRKLLLDLGLKPESIKVTIDPVFGLAEDSEGPKAKGLLAKAAGPLIGVSIRPWKDNSYLQELALACNEMAAKTGGELVLIPMHFQEDLSLSQDFLAMLDVPAQLLSSNYTPWEMIALFRELDFLIGVRLHSLIFAVLQAVPFVAISYDPKVKSLLKMLELNMGLEIDTLTASSLNKLCETAWLNQEKISKQLKDKRKEFAQLALANAELVADLCKFKR